MFSEGTQTASINLLAQVAKEKEIHLTHYNQFIQELVVEINVLEPGSSSQVLSGLNRLVDYQKKVGRYQLSPKHYEAGLEQLKKILQTKKPLQSMALERLQNIQADFRQSLRLRPDWVRGCFKGEVQQLLHRYQQGNLDLTEPYPLFVYYASVMEPSDYYEELLALKETATAHHLEPVIQALIQQLLDQVDPIKTIRSHLNRQSQAFETAPKPKRSSAAKKEPLTRGLEQLLRVLKSMLGEALKPLLELFSGLKSFNPSDLSEPSTPTASGPAVFHRTVLEPETVSFNPHLIFSRLSANPKIPVQPLSPTIVEKDKRTPVKSKRR